MVGLLPRGWGALKPALGARVDAAHPHAHALRQAFVFNAGAGRLAPEALTGRPWRGGSGNGSSYPVYRGGHVWLDGNAYFTPSGPVLQVPLVTILARFRYGGATGGTQCVVGFADGAGGGNHDKELQISTAGVPNAYVFDGGAKNATAPTALTVGQWYDLALVADGINLSLYINAVRVAQVACGTTFVGYTVPNVILGYGGSGLTAALGHLAHVYIWSRPLAVTQLRTLLVDPYGLFVPPLNLLRLAAAVPLQAVYPVSDVSVGGWTAAPLWIQIDEPVANDTDFIQSALNPSGDTAEVAVGTLLAPGEGPVTVTVRMRRSGLTATEQLTLALYQGSTLIGLRTVNDLTAAYQEIPYTLTPGERAAITDWAALRVRLIATEVP